MDNESKIEMMTKKNTWAVIGATPAPEKISNKIYHTLRKHNYQVFSVNPNYDKMDNGDPCYSSLFDLPIVPDCVDFVVPPAVTRTQLEEMDPAIYPNIWLQPGTYNDEIVAFAEKKGFIVVHEGACVMGYLKKNGRPK